MHKHTHMLTVSKHIRVLWLVWQQALFTGTRQGQPTEEENRKGRTWMYLFTFISTDETVFDLYFMFILFQVTVKLLVVHVHESKDAQKCFLRLIRREAAVSVRFCDLWFQISSFMSLQLGANRSVWFKYNNHVVRVCKKIIFSLK